MPGEVPGSSCLLCWISPQTWPGMRLTVSNCPADVSWPITWRAKFTTRITTSGSSPGSAARLVGVRAAPSQIQHDARNEHHGARQAADSCRRV